MKRLIVLTLVAAFAFAATAQAQWVKGFSAPIWFHTNAR